MKVLIVEDESAAARRLEKLLGEIDPELEVAGLTDSIEGTVSWLTENPHPDLVLMDIHLADGSSFEIFNLVKLEKPVIFTTAYDEYALQAFRVMAIDYLLKPIKLAELEGAIGKYRRLQAQAAVDYQRLSEVMNKDARGKRFVIRVGSNIRVVEIRDVAYFYTQDKITFLITREGKRYPVDFSMEKLEEMLDPQQFFRINRKFLVQVESIRNMVAYSKSRVKLELQPPCDLETIVSTERSPHFKKWLNG